MSKFKFVNIIDTIFISVATFLIIFAWVQFFLKNFIISLILSTLITIGVILLIRWFRSKKHTSQQTQLIKNSNLALFKLAIQTMSTTKLITTIKKLLPAKYSARSYKGDIIFTKNNTPCTFTFYYSSELNEAKLLELIKTKNAQHLTIFCSYYTQDVKTISKAFKNKQIELITLDQLFEIFASKNIKIDTSHIDINSHKITIKEILKNTITRNKSKGYFISGLVILFSSIIIPYRIYYVMFSSILFILSLICRIRPSTKPNNSIFD